MKRSKPGIWVMEGEWSRSVTDVRTVGPVIQALADAGVAKSATRRLNDRDDLLNALKRWGQKQHSTYGIGYMALHGEPGVVQIGRKRIDLFEVADELPRNLLRGKVLHFGSCAVLNLDSHDQLAQLRSAFGVRAVTGFTEDVEWFDSMAFELLLFDSLTYYSRMDAVDRDLKRRAGDLGDRLGFTIIRA